MAIAAVVWLACGCQSDTPRSSEHLEPVTDIDFAPDGDEFCSLSGRLGGTSRILMHAGEERGIVRVEGRLFVLHYTGGDVRSGGVFESRGLRVEVRGVRGWRSASTEPIGRGVHVVVQNGHQREVFGADWNCRP